MKKIKVKTIVYLDIHMDEDADLETIMSEMDYNFVDTTYNANVVDTEIRHYEIV